jgi:co-chaperonin GroES (HSP10)
MLRGIGYINEGGIMYLEPTNRHLLVLPIETQEEEKSLIVLPDEYKAPAAPYVSCDVLGIAIDCSVQVSIGDTIVVERRMLQEIKAAGETNYLVLENYVYGRLQDE